MARDANFMREIARKGGLSTSARAKKDPEFYQRIGAMGGHARGKPKKPRKKNTSVKTAKPKPPAAFPVEHLAASRPVVASSQNDAIRVLDDLIGLP